MNFSFFRKNRQTLPEYWLEYEAAFSRGYAKNTPLEEVRFVVFDTETTGLDIPTDSILSVGAVALKNNQINIEERLEYYVKQHYRPDKVSIAVHGILPAHPAQGKEELEAIKAFLKFAGSSVLVAHHAAFDLGMINNILNREIGKKLKNKVVDTAFLAQRLAFQPKLSRPGTFGLDNLCHLYQIPTSDRHTASGDAYITAILFLKLLARLRKRGVHRLNDLLRTKRLI